MSRRSIPFWAIWHAALLVSTTLAPAAQAQHADLRLWHGVELSPSQLLLSFELPQVLPAPQLRLRLLTDQFRLATGVPCRAVVAASFAVKSCVVAGGFIEIDIQDSLANTSQWLELRGQHVAAPGIRLCTSHPSGVFLKIGGRLNETTLGSESQLNSNIDKCCREDSTTCYRFDSLSACEAQKWTISCLSCEENGHTVGCPTFEAPEGYAIHVEETLCNSPGSAQSFASVAECASYCTATGYLGFSISNGFCIPSLGGCCEGDVVADVGSYSFGNCSNSTGPWRFAASLHWSHEGVNSSFDFGIKEADGQGAYPLLHKMGGLASFNAFITPDMGLTESGVLTTLELTFALTRAARVGDVLTFVPIPSAPFDFGLAGGSPLEVDGFDAALLFTDLPAGANCTWQSVGANSVNGKPSCN